MEIVRSAIWNNSIASLNSLEMHAAMELLTDPTGQRKTSSDRRIFRNKEINS
jgi:hypothetical protein